MRSKAGHSMMRHLSSTHHAEEWPKPRAPPDRHAEHQKLRLPPHTLLAQTSRLESPASGWLQSRSPCSERQHHPACQPPREPQRSAQTTDARHTGPPETRSRGRSLVFLYNEERPHQALGYRMPMGLWREGQTVKTGAAGCRHVDNARALPTGPQQQQQKNAIAA